MLFFSFLYMKYLSFFLGNQSFFKVGFVLAAEGVWLSFRLFSFIYLFIYLFVCLFI